jgi:transcriptional regulator with XRE-family HTH domain
MTRPPADLPITPQQCRDARKLLGWSEVDLAHRTGVGPAALGRFESGSGALDRDILGRILGVFEAAGVEFVHSGVSLKSGPGAPKP